MREIWVSASIKSQVLSPIHTHLSPSICNSLQLLSFTICCQPFLPRVSAVNLFLKWNPVWLLLVQQKLSFFPSPLQLLLAHPWNLLQRIGIFSRACFEGASREKKLEVPLHNQAQSLDVSQYLFSQNLLSQWFHSKMPGINYQNQSWNKRTTTVYRSDLCICCHVVGREPGHPSPLLRNFAPIFSIEGQLQMLQGPHTYHLWPWWLEPMGVGSFNSIRMATDLPPPVEGSKP